MTFGGRHGAEETPEPPTAAAAVAVGARGRNALSGRFDFSAPSVRARWLLALLKDERRHRWVWAAMLPPGAVPGGGAPQ